MWRLLRLKLTGQRRCVKIIRMMYKRRFLLRLDPFRLPIRRSVATIAPTKRGLKEASLFRMRPHPFGSNHCPDEKGTESRLSDLLILHIIYRSNHCPDEKGTESLQWVKLIILKVIS